MKDLDKFFWFLGRPALYPEFVRKFKRRFTPRRAEDQTSEVAELWCAERAVDTQTALLKLIGATHYVPLRQNFPEMFASSEGEANACPVQMGGPGNLDLLYYLCEHSRAVRCLETGVAYGWSSLAILLSVSTRPDGRLVSTDMPYPSRNNDPYVGCVVPKNLHSRWHVIRRADREALPEAINALGSLDMCHYDSDKSYEGRQWAYRLLWAALRTGGLFLSDDIGDNVGFRDFSRAIQQEPLVVSWDKKYIGIVVKS